MRDKDVPFSTYAYTANQTATANGLDALDQSSAIYGSVVTLQSGAAATQAFDALSGEFMQA